MKERVVIIGANDFQNQLILRAKAAGYETHVFAWAAGDVGEKTADYFYPISIVEKEAILEKCRELHPAGICSIGSDLAMHTVNYVAHELGLTANSLECTLLSTNKAMMRKAFQDNGDPSPRSVKCHAVNELDLTGMTFPLIVKPTDRSGSRAVTKVASADELPQAIEAAAAQSFEHCAVVEEFVDGVEYSVEYVSYRGQHTFLALTRKFTTGAPHFIEIGHYEPADVPARMQKEIQHVVEHALTSLKVEYGASHSEVKITPDGQVKLIEIGARMGGDCIGSDLVRLSTGRDFMGMVLDIACGKKPSLEPVDQPGFAYIHFVFSQKDIDFLRRIQSEAPQLIFRVSEIDDSLMQTVTDSSTRGGYFILSAQKESEITRLRQWIEEYYHENQ